MADPISISRSTRDDVVEHLLRITFSLSDTMETLRFRSPVAHVYNPLVYARRPHEQFLRNFAGSKGCAILLGMNPGPWGMAQTGVPFGEVNLVRDWLGIDEPVDKPDSEHPKRPILGFDCPRSEVSGRRLWGWARDHYKTPRQFFEHFFVVNYCPLVFMESSGKNRTPDKLPAGERNSLFEACDISLRQIVDTLEPGLVIGVGRFAELRAIQSLDGRDVRIGRILHPSPASPAANKGWAEQATSQLTELGVL